MKIYYFTVIIVGMMILLGVAGVDTQSSKLFSYFQKDPADMTSDLNRESSIREATQIKSQFQASIIFAVIATLGIFIFLTNTVTIGTFQMQVSSEAIYGGVGLGLLALFLADFISIISLIYTLEGSGSWLYWGIASVMIPLMVGYLISIIEFVRGTD